MRYRRARYKGGTYFFTVNLADRSSTHLTDRIDDLRSVLRLVKRRHRFHIDAMVVLPDHVHTLWTLPPADDDYPLRWSLIKRGSPGSHLQASHVAAAADARAKEVFGSDVIGSM